MTTVTADARVCVIGSGVMGASAAFHLAAHGVQTLIVEKGSPGGEASGATAGTIAAQNKPLPLLPLVRRSLELWETLAERLGRDVEYERRGGFRVAHTDEDVQNLERAVGAERSQGLDVEMVYQPQLVRVAPYLSRKIAAASYCAKDGMANPFAALHGFLHAARQRGARLWSGTEVTGIRVIADNKFLIETTRGSVRSDNVIAAAGAWNLEIAQMVGVSLPVTTAPLQVMVTDVGPSLFPHIVTHVRENLTLKQQRATGKILIGGGWQGDADRASGIKRICRESLVGNLRWATDAIPGIVEARVLRGWIGFEGRTPDKLLICGPAGPRGFYVLGCSYSGFTLSPIAGQIAAEYVVSGQTEIPCQQFSVRRFLPAEAG